MKIEECAVGMKVKAYTKSEGTFTLKQAKEEFPDGIFTIRRISGNIIFAGGEKDFMFSPSDIVPVEYLYPKRGAESLPIGVGTSKVIEPKMLALMDMLRNARTGVTRHRVEEPAIVSLSEGNDADDDENNEWVSLKPITIQALEESGSCETDLHRFAMKAIEVDFSYYREPIPPSIAIDLCDTLGIIWDGLVTKGFIRQKRDVFNPAAVKVCTGLRTAHIMYDGWAIASLDKNGVQLLGQIPQENVPFPVNSAGCAICREEDAFHAINYI